MQLTRIQLSQFRKFRGALDIRDLSPGLNLFTGPNEAGKSTIAAAIRAAFFERHRSNAAQEFRPEGDSSATPSIALEFHTGGTQYRLSKQFLGRKRCTLEFDGRKLDGDDAEDHLAGLLGYQYAGKGRSKAEHWGIPGLLWIEQGNSHELDSAIAHAVEHLRTALGGDAGRQSEESDLVLSSVMQQRNALLTPSGGAPRGDYAQAQANVAQLQEALQAIRNEVRDYRDKVDRLADLQARHAADEAAQPWQTAHAQQQQAQQQLQETRQLDHSLQELLVRQRDLRETARLLQDQLQHLATRQQTIAQRQAAVTQATDALHLADAAVQHWQQRHAQAAQTRQQTQTALERMHQAARLADLIRERQDSLRQLDAAGRRLEQADEANRSLQALQAALADLPADDKPLTRLRDCTRRLDELRIRQQANATRLQFALHDGATLTLDAEPLHGSGERLLTADATLELPGTGTLRIRPGGEGLEALRDEHDTLARQSDTLLAQLGAASLQDAETRHLRAIQLRADSAMRQESLRLHAPEGADALRIQLASLQARLSGLDARIASERQAIAASHGADGSADIGADGSADTKVDAGAGVDSSIRDSGAGSGNGDAPIDTSAAANDTPAAMDLSQAQAAHQHAQTALDDAREQLHQAQLRAGAARTQHEHAEREQQAALLAIDAEQDRSQNEQWQRRLTDIQAELAQADVQAGILQQKIAQARPDILQQDVERYRLSADGLLQQHRQRHDAILRLEAELQALGAHGLDEREAELAQTLAQAQRSAEALARRARALDHLQQLLRDRQQAATQALQAPLQAHLRHYLDLLFPGAELSLGDALSPDTLRRRLPDGMRADLIATLSHGAREQIGVIGRLACADLLRAAGRPTLLILDDALVHTDEVRLAQMKRILFDAATRHQILMFSCHPSWWLDLGIAPRDIDSLATSTLPLQESA